MTSKRMAHDVNMCKKHSFTPIVTNIFDDTKRAKKMLLALLHLSRLFFSHKSHYRLYYNGISAFMRKSLMLTKISSNNAKYLKFHCRKVEPTEEMANSGDYPGDFRL